MNDQDQTTSVPAVGISITANLNGDRQIVLQYFVPGDADAKTKNAAVVMLNDIVDHQQARYQIREFEAEVEKMERSLEQAKLDLPKVDVIYQEQVKELERQATEWDAKSDEAYQVAYNDFVGRGRTGAFSPQGGQKLTIEAPKAEAAKIRETIKAKDADAALGRQQVEKSIQHFEEQIADRRTAIAKREAILKE